jgi:hypothetical protein
MIGPYNTVHTDMLLVLDTVVPSSPGLEQRHTALKESACPDNTSADKDLLVL